MTNLVPETVPTLDERECSLINLYRVLPESQKSTVLQLVFELAINGKKAAES